MARRPQDPIPPPAAPPGTALSPPAPALRLMGILLAAGCLLLGLVTLLLLDTELSFRRLPPLTDTSNLATIEMLDRELGRLVRRDPTNGEIRNAWASVLGRQRDYVRAIEQLERALRVQHTQNSLYFLAGMHERLGQHELAEQAMADSVVINPSQPGFTPYWLRLLLNRVQELQRQQEQRSPVDRDAFEQARRRFAEATRAWSVRAPHDPNAWLFMGNQHIIQMQGVRRQTYMAQAYRQFLLGLAGAELDPATPLWIGTDGARATINQILQYGYAKQHRGLP